MRGHERIVVCTWCVCLLCLSDPTSVNQKDNIVNALGQVREGIIA
jgi:hypothetical protein